MPPPQPNRGLIYTSQSSGHDLIRSSAASSDQNFLTFLATAHFYEIDFLDIVYESALDHAAVSGTSEIYQSSLDPKVDLIFKRTRFIEDESGKSWNAKRTFASLVSEISVLHHPLLRYHQNIVNLEAISWEITGDQDSVWPILVLEKGDLGDLEHFIDSEMGRTLNLDDKLGICADIATAIQALHNYGGVHGDIKPQNVLIFRGHGESVFGKVADFGYSFLANGSVEDDFVKPAKSWPWYAPEHHHRGFSITEGRQLDAFSFGMLCFWVLSHSQLVGERSSIEKCLEVEGILYELGDIHQITMYEILQMLKDRNCLQSVALRFVETTASIAEDQKENLSRLFKATLAHEPAQRDSDFARLVTYLSQDWIPGPSTEDSVNLRVVSPYPYLQIAQSIFQLMKCQYSIREYIVKSLQDYAISLPVNHAHYANTTFQLAFCYYLGFGVVRDACQADRWLALAGRPKKDIEAQLEVIKSTTHPYVFRNGNLMTLLGQGILNRDNLVTRYIGSGDVGRIKALYRRQIEDMEIVVGRSSPIVFDLRSELFDLRLRTEGAIEDVENTLVEEIDVLLPHQPECNGQQLIKDPRLRSWRQQFESRQVASLVIELPELEARSPLLRKLEVSIGRLDFQLIRLLQRLAELYVQQSRLAEAEWVSVCIRRQQVWSEGEEHPVVLSSNVAIGAIYVMQNRYENAKTLFNDTLRMSERVLGKEHSVTLQIVFELAQLHIHSGYRPEIAQPLLMQIINIRMKPSTRGAKISESDFQADGPFGQYQHLLETCEILSKSDQPNIHVINSLNSLAQIYRLQDFSPEAVNLQQHLSDICKKSLPPDHPQTIDVLQSLAVTYAGTDRWEEARSLLAEVIERRDRVLGKAHWSSLVSLGNLAACYKALGELSQAEMLYRQVIEGQEKSHGNNARATMKSKYNLAVTMEARGDTRTAKGIVEGILGKQRSLLGEENQDVMESVGFLATLHVGEGKLDAAEKLLIPLIDRKKRILGAVHSDVRGNLKWLAKVYIRQRKWQEAIKFLKQVRQIEQARLVGGSDDSWQALDSMMLLGGAYFGMRQWKEAEAIVTHVIAKRKEKLGPDHPSTRWSMHSLGCCLWHQWRWREAANNWYHAWRWIWREGKLRTKLIGMRDFFHCFLNT